MAKMTCKWQGKWLTLQACIRDQAAGMTGNAGCYRSGQACCCFSCRSAPHRWMLQPTSAQSAQEAAACSGKPAADKHVMGVGTACMGHAAAQFMAQKPALATRGAMLPPVTLKRLTWAKSASSEPPKAAMLSSVLCQVIPIQPNVVIFTWASLFPKSSSFFLRGVSSSSPAASCI